MSVVFYEAIGHAYRVKPLAINFQDRQCASYTHALGFVGRGPCVIINVELILVVNVELLQEQPRGGISSRIFASCVLSIITGRFHLVRGFLS